ncbi:phosphatidylserine lipase ABHD16A isoform X2 [Zalophus californianus]|uniref:acylglycerol lipase n=1 Tax=Zalophus californianus TaxID=9704 RepID=A0A6J2DSY0_ZALCA|nr:phosphatidylserine lipase ABHD16A isoform X2 [Zalophus californianus]
MAKLLSCVLGPRLYKIYRERDSERAPSGVPETPTSVTTPPSSSWDTYYQPRALEKHADSILALASVFWSISYYSSPFAAFYLYRKGYLSLSKVVPFSHYAGTLLLLLAGVACLRGIGRWTNPQYRQFITILEATHRNQSAENKRQLANYNFDFKSWPVDFHWEEPSSRKESRGGPSRQGVALLRPEPLHRGTADTLLNRVKKLPCQITSYLVAHTLGRRMLYPGSVYLLQKALMPVLLQGQARLVEECNGRRAKLLAFDGNEIDTMFVDRRGAAEPQGQKLVICCEGNAGFYEVGCISTPLEAGYSVLGWNHPGFAGSTGVPFPQNEANAMDVVVQFAIHRLGFQPQDIIIYAWSIGGFTGGLVTRTVRQHLNLNNAEQLCRYQGPVLLIRRTKDEIITTTVPEDIMSNRGNDLLLKLLQYRYPRVMAEEGLRVVRQWLEASSQLEEGARGCPEACGWGRGKARSLTRLPSLPAQPRSTAVGRWRRTGAYPSSAPTRQNTGLTFPGVWGRTWMQTEGSSWPCFWLRSICTTLRPHTAPRSQPRTSRCPGTSSDHSGTRSERVGQEET